MDRMSTPATEIDRLRDLRDRTHRAALNLRQLAIDARRHGDAGESRRREGKLAGINLVLGYIDEALACPDASD